MNNNRNYYELDAGFGESIKDYADRAIKFAQLHDGIITYTEFNGFRIEVTADITPDDVVKQYHNKRKQAEEAYLASEQYQIDLKARQEETDKLNKECEKLLEIFNTLNLDCKEISDKVALLQWLSEYQPYSDNVCCTSSDDRLVCDKLAKHGFKADDFVDSKEAETLDNKFMWLVGQAISAMLACALHGVVAYRAKELIEEYKKSKLITNKEDA